MYNIQIKSFKKLKKGYKLKNINNYGSFDNYNDVIVRINFIKSHSSEFDSIILVNDDIVYSNLDNSLNILN